MILTLFRHGFAITEDNFQANMAFPEGVYFGLMPLRRKFRFYSPVTLQKG